MILGIQESPLNTQLTRTLTPKRKGNDMSDSERKFNDGELVELKTGERRFITFVFIDNDDEWMYELGEDDCYTRESDLKRVAPDPPGNCDKLKELTAMYHSFSLLLETIRHNGYITDESKIFKDSQKATNEIDDGLYIEDLTFTKKEA